MKTAFVYSSPGLLHNYCIHSVWSESRLRQQLYCHQHSQRKESSPRSHNAPWPWPTPGHSGHWYPICYKSGDRAWHLYYHSRSTLLTFCGIPALFPSLSNPLVIHLNYSFFHSLILSQKNILSSHLAQALCIMHSTRRIQDEVPAFM